jgi:hypothetical protein
MQYIVSLWDWITAEFLSSLVVPERTTLSIFSFAVFVQGMTLLVLVFTFADDRYRFRISTAPLPLERVTFHGIWFIGLGALLSDLWFYNDWPIPKFLANQSVDQAILGFLFLLITLVWVWFAFISPPKYGRFNHERFARTLYRYISFGSPSALPSVAAELARSARGLISFAAEKRNTNPVSMVSNTANDILLLIADPRFCKQIVAHYSVAAIAILDETIHQKKFGLPLGQFSRNIGAAAIENLDSPIYVEESMYDSGLLGHLKTFSMTLFGNFQLVEALSQEHMGPLDIGYSTNEGWNQKRFEAYTRMLMLTCKSYISGGYWYTHSYAIYRAFEKIKHAGSSLYTIDDSVNPVGRDAAIGRFQVACRFVKDLISFMDEVDAKLIEPKQLRKRRTDRHRNDDLYDLISDTLYDLIFSSSSIKTKEFISWHLQHNTVWNAIFGFGGGHATRVVQFKLRRRLYDEIAQLSVLPNYEGARILGYCLNVMGLKEFSRKDFRKTQNPLHTVILRWTRSNYLKMRNKLPDVAASALVGRITFNARSQSLICTYEKALSKRAPKEYLKLRR